MGQEPLVPPGAALLARGHLSAGRQRRRAHFGQEPLVPSQCGRRPAALRVRGPCAQRQRASSSVARKKCAAQQVASVAEFLARPCFRHPRVEVVHSSIQAHGSFQAFRSSQGPSQCPWSQPSVCATRRSFLSSVSIRPACPPAHQVAIRSPIHFSLWPTVHFRISPHAVSSFVAIGIHAFAICVCVFARLVSMHLSHIASRYGGGKKDDSTLPSRGSCAGAV